MYSQGVYQIWSKVNDKSYIGSTNNSSIRWNTWKCHLKHKRCTNKSIQTDYNTYGLDNFTFEIVEEVEDKTQLRKREQYWLDTMKATDPAKVYNILKDTNSRKGMPAWNKGKRNCYPRARTGKTVYYIPFEGIRFL